LEKGGEILEKIEEEGLKERNLERDLIIVGIAVFFGE